MLPSRIWLAVALASPLASARPSGCDASEIDSIDACMKPQLMSRGLREWMGCRNPFTGTLYEEQSDKSRINPLNWFGGCPESKQGKQGQPAQQAQRIAGSSGSAHSKGSEEAVDDPSSASNPNANQVNAPAIEVVDRIPSLTESMDGVGLDHSGSARGTFPNQPQSTGINNARSGLQSAPSSREGKKTVLYYGNYAIYDRKYNPADVPIEEITHLIYSFAKIDEQSGEVMLSDEWADVQINRPGEHAKDDLYGSLGSFNALKARNRNLKLMLAIGGWGSEKEFANAASSPDKRRKFTESSLKLLSDLGLDGFDVDWEYPTTPEDAKNVVLLLQELRQALDNYANKLKEQSGENVQFVMSFAGPAAHAQFNALPIREMDQYLDFWNVMTYDFAGDFSDFTGHQAGLYQSETPNASPAWADAAIKYFKSQVASPSKLIFGMPLYGRSFAGTEGLGMPFKGAGAGSSEDGIVELKHMKPAEQYTQYDETAKASYLYIDQTKVLISFDTVKVAEVKAQYVKDESLGGAMFWMAGMDEEGPNSRVSKVVNQFGGIPALEQTANNVFYPDSRYENMKDGFLNDRSSSDEYQNGPMEGQQPQTQPLPQVQPYSGQQQQQHLQPQVQPQQQNPVADVV